MSVSVRVRVGFRARVRVWRYWHLYWLLSGLLESIIGDGRSAEQERRSLLTAGHKQGVQEGTASQVAIAIFADYYFLHDGSYNLSGYTRRRDQGWQCVSFKVMGSTDSYIHLQLFYHIELTVPKYQTVFLCSCACASSVSKYFCLERLRSQRV